MEIDALIEAINQKLKANGVSLENLDISNLTEQELIFINTYNPHKSIIIYGSLAPNRPNHSKINHIKGSWNKGIVKGKLENEGWGAALGFYGFKYSKLYHQENIEAYILQSDELVDNWTNLDDFEGNGYRRLLAKYTLENGEIGVGNIYAINEITY